MEDLCEVVRGGSPRPAGSKEFYDGDIPFLKVADLTKNEDIYVYKAENTIKEAGLKKTRMVNEGTLLLTNSGATLGVPKITNMATTFNDGIAAFLYLPKQIVLYIYWYLKSMTNSFRSIDQGAAQPNLNTNLIKDVTIPLPSIAEQKRIVAEINRWYALIDIIEHNKLSLQDAIKQTKSRILDFAIHGKLVPQEPTDEPASELLKRINPNAEITCDTPHYRKLPEGWVIAHLSNIAEIKNGYAFKSSNYISSNGIRIIRIANVQDGFIEDKTPQYYPKESCDDIENFFLKEKDLLMSLTGNVGRVGLLPKSFLPAALNQRVACIRENELLIDKEYLYYLFQSNEFQRKCIKSAKGVAQLNISTEWLKCYQIPIPPMAEQKRIVETISLLFANLRMIEASL